MKKSCLFVFVLSLLLFSACDNEFDFDDPEENSGKLRTVRMEKTTIGDGQVTVAWGSKLHYEDANTKCIMIPDLEPEKFTIYKSFDPDKDFTKVVELKNRKDPYFEYTIEDLENGKPVYFYVESSRKDYDSEVSPTIMVVPNREVKPQFIFQEANTSDFINHIRYCPTNKKIVFNTFLNSENKNPLVVSNLDGSEREMINENRSLYDVCWSSDGNMVVYSTVIGSDKTVILYDLKTKEESILFTEPASYMFRLAISPDCKKILYTSLDDATERKYSIRLFDMETKEIANILKRDEFSSLESIDWINNEDFIFEARETAYEYPYYSCVYKASVNSDKCENIFHSQWIDTDISLSPDKKRIAFSSNRSGNTQLWLYDIEKKQFSQLTGFDVNQREAYGISRPGWIDNQTIHYLENARNIRTLSID